MAENENQNPPTLEQVVNSYEEMTGQTPDTTTFAFMQAIVRDEQQK